METQKLQKETLDLRLTPKKKKLLTYGSRSTRVHGTKHDRKWTKTNRKLKNNSTFDTELPSSYQ